MNGVLVIDKPVGLTSHDVVARVRRALKIKRVGHTGTLDPFATGVMVILVGQATRLAQFLDKDEKDYEAVVRFGFETDTGDVTGLRTADCGLRIEEIQELLAKVDWDEVFSKFRGEIEQVPPMYSAKKVAGKKLYELARKGIEVERKSVKITIQKLEILDAEQIRNPQSSPPGLRRGGRVSRTGWSIRLRVACSAGTYIRTLAEDIGRAIGVGAHLAELRRTRAGKFDLSQSLTLEELDKTENAESVLVSMSDAIDHLPKLVLNADRVGKTKNGLSTRYEAAQLADDQAIQMLDEDGNLIAVGFYNDAEKIVQPKVVLS